MRTTTMDPSCPGRNFLRSLLGRAREPRGAIKLMVTRAGNSLRSVCHKSTTWPLRLVIYRGRILRPMSADDDNDDSGWCFLAFVAVGGNTWNWVSIADFKCRIPSCTETRSLSRYLRKREDFRFRFPLSTPVSLTSARN